MKAQKFITTLSTADKIKLYNALYEDLSGKGIEGDTELAHVNKEEMAVLLAMGGAGTINPNTGLVQFMGGGGQSGSSTQQQEFPEEMKPYISDILGRSKAIYEQRADEGFQPYTGPRIAEFDPSQQAAMSGIEGMVGGAEPAYQAGFGQLGQAGQTMGTGQALTGAGAATVGTGLGYIDPGAQAIQSGLAGIAGGQANLGQAYGMAGRGEQGLMAGEQMLSPAASLAAASARDVRGDIGSYMSPYMRQVIDVQKREAQRASDIAGQQQAAQAVQAGAFGGSRQAILEAERERNLAQQLGDIEATGMQAAYQDAARMAEAQRARQLAASGQFGQLAGQAGQLGLGRGQLAGTLGQLSATQGSLGTQAGGLGSQLAGLSSLTTGAGQALGSLGSSAANIGTQQAGLGMQYGQLGSAQQAQRAQDYQNLMNVGAMRQGQTQTALDQAYQQFLQEQEFPMQSLQDYSSIIRGYYKAPSLYTTTTPATPSGLQQIAGLGTTALGAYGAFGGFKKTGGKVDPKGGLGSIVVKKQEGGRFVPPTRSRFTDPNYENPIGKDIENLVKYLISGDMFEEGEPMFTLKGGQKFGGKKFGGKKFGGREFGASRKPGAKDYDIGMGFEYPKDTEALINRIQKNRELDKKAADIISSPKDATTQPKKTDSSSGLRINPIIKENIKNVFTSKGSEDLKDAEELRRLRDRARMTNPEYADFLDKKIKEELQAKSPLSHPDSLLGKLVSMPRTLLGVPYDEGDDLKYQTGIPSELKPLLNAQAVKASEDTAKKPLAARASTIPEDTEKGRLDESIIAQGMQDPLGEGEDNPALISLTNKVEEVTTSSPYAKHRLPDVLKKTREEYMAAVEKRQTEKGEELEKKRTGLDRNRWLAVADLGVNILAQPGGQTFLQALGKGAKDSDIINKLSKLNDEEAELASKIKDLPVETIAAKFKLKENEASYIKDAANFEIKMAELEAAKAKATSTAERNRIDDMIKALNLRLKTAEFDLKRSGQQSKLSKEDIEIAKDFYNKNINKLGENEYTYQFWKDSRKKLESEFLDAVRRNRSKSISEIFDAFVQKYRKK